MVVIAHLLRFALIFIACTFDFMRLALVPEKIKCLLDIPSLIIVALPTVYCTIFVCMARKAMAIVGKLCLAV